MPAPVTRRAFLKLTALATCAAAMARLMPSRALAAARACLPVWGTEVPTLVPTAVGDNCAPPPTATETATATASATPTPYPTATASPTATPWRVRLPWVSR